MTFSHDIPSVSNSGLASAAMVVLLVAAVPGQGGAEPFALLVWHGILAAGLAIALMTSGPGKRGLGLSGKTLATAIGCLGIVGIVFASYRYAAWIQLLELGAFVGVLALAARCGAGLPARLALPLLVVGAAEAGLVLVQVLEGSARPAGTFLNTNHLAGWLAAVIVLNLDPLVLLGGSTRRRALQFSLIALAVVGLALTGSRGGWAGILCACGLLAWLSWKRISVVARRVLVVSVLVLGFAGAAVVAIRLVSPDPFPYQRLKIWRASAETVIDSPWLGAGPGQFPTVVRAYQFPDGLGPLRYDRNFSTTHSDLLRAVCDFGLPGLSLLVLGAYCLRGLFRRTVREGRTVAGRAGALGALVALCVQATVENLSVRPAVYLLAAALLGSQLSRLRPTSVGVTLPVRFALAVCLGMVFLVGDVAPYLAWRQAAGLPSGALSPGQESRLTGALRRNPVHPDLWMHRAEHLAGPGTVWEPPDYALARSAAERAVTLHPEDAGLRRRSARIEALACRTLFPDVACRERAAAGYAAAAERAPFDPFVRLEMAGFLLDTGDTLGARAAAHEVLALEPEAVVPRLLLADARLQEGSDEGRAAARRLLAEAEARARDWSEERGESAYSQQLLRLDPRVVNRLRSEIGGEDSVDQAPPIRSRGRRASLLAPPGERF